MFKAGLGLEIISQTTNIPLKDLKKFFKMK